MASFTRYRDGWRAHVYVKGARVTKVFEKKRDAQNWALETENALEGYKASKGMTFAQATAKYVISVSRDKSEGSSDWEARRFAQMAEFFGEHSKLAGIDSARIGEWRDWRLAQVSASTVLRERALLQSLFSVAAKEWKVLKGNPFEGVRMPDHNPARHQVWTWRLIRRVLRTKRDGAGQEAIHTFHIALHTAMRLSEILGAEVSGKVAILAKDKTTRAQVKVPLARKGAVLLAKYGPFKSSPNVVSAAFSRLCQELLIEGLTLHDARASALTWLSRRMDVMTLARISRHRDLRTLMNTYYRETAEQIADRV